VIADEIVAAACGVRYTAAVLRIERAGRAVFERAYGHVDAEAGSQRVTVTTAFDLASLTKPFVASAALCAVAAGTLELDAPLVRIVPEWSGFPQAAITLRMLLAHTSGMQSGADYRTLFDRELERFALECELVASPGERVTYSDLGFIALGVVLARAYRGGLATVAMTALRALRCEKTFFRVRERERAEIPATECDPWRGRVRGRVHDEKAYLMNGVAGHAGLFATARDVAALAEAYLAHARGRKHELLSRTLAHEALAEHGRDDVLRRGFGWALKTSDRNSCGAAMSRATFGHTGFTGTSVWADPACDLVVVLLTNAVYFGRHDLRDVRAAVCDAAVAEYA